MEIVFNILGIIFVTMILLWFMGTLRSIHDKVTQLDEYMRGE